MNLDLKKQLDLSKAVVLDLSKQKDIEGHKAQVVVVVDRSGSMSQLYSDGTVQKVIQRLVPIAMAFDDNAEMECFEFSNGVKELAPITLNNLENYVPKNFISSMGGTNYAPAINAIVKQHVERPGVQVQSTASVRKVKAGEKVVKKAGFFAKLFGASDTVETEYKDEEVKNISSSKSPLPTYVIFITDGYNSDEHRTKQAMIDASNHGIFFQFVGISTSGSSSFPQLEALDTMTGRRVDNANFFQIKTKDLSGGKSDAELYGQLLNEYPLWLKSAKTIGLI